VELEPNFLGAREWLAWRALATGHHDIATMHYDEIRRRSQRYAGTTTDDYEMALLRVAPSKLAAALEKAS
jgi:hypothetical protein